MQLLPRTSLRILLVMALAAVTSGSGCLRAYNPTYFPNWGFGGDLVRTHAKPAGRTYYKNFDPNACRIELTPMQCQSAVGNQQLFVATVIDSDGQPRRSRRVEWIIDGPGYIVEVDESGWFGGRGYKVDNKYAVSHTSYREAAFTRGNDDPRDDFLIEPGQTWCVVSSAVEGVTTVTAYAPAVYNWSSGRTTATVAWGSGVGLPGGSWSPPMPSQPPNRPGPGGDFLFPEPTISRAGGEVNISTTVSLPRGTPEEYLVRYKVLDGPPAELVYTPVSSGVRQTSSGRYYEAGPLAEVQADNRGSAAVTVRQPEARAGKTRIGIEIIEPNGNGPGRIVKRSETAVEWTAARLKLNIDTPKVATPDRELPVTITVQNQGELDAEGLTLRATVPDGTEFVNAVPGVNARQGKVLVWNLERLASGRRQEVSMVVKPTRRGRIELAADAETEDGTRVEERQWITVDLASLKLKVEPPSRVPVGEPVELPISVTNTGEIPLERVSVWLTADNGLTLPGKEMPFELQMGSIPPNRTNRATVRVTAEQAGRFVARFNATADGGVTDRAETTLEARTASLGLSITGPDQVVLGEQAVWEIKAVNNGDIAIEKAEVQAALPAGLIARSAGESGEVIADDRVLWNLGTLPPSGKQTLRLTARADGTFSTAPLRVRAAAEEFPKLAETETPVSASGRPLLSVELPDPPGTVPVEGRGPVQVVLRNKGSGPAKDVELSLETSPELRILAGTGPNGERGLVQGNTVRFPTIASVPANRQFVFQVTIEAVTPGPARVSASATADHLERAVRDEQSTRVVPR